jgi:nucleotide-binding universal stress UspA family protein
MVTMFNNMLVPLDGSALAECVLPHSVALARAFSAKVTLLRVLEGPQADDDRLVDPLDWHICRGEAEAYLADWAGRLRDVGVESGYKLVHGRVTEQVVDFVRDHGISLMVLSSHGHGGLGGWNVSGTVQKIIFHVHISVMMVRAYTPIEIDLTELDCRRLLVPLDGSQRAEAALAPAQQLASFYSSQVLLASVVSKPEVVRRRPLTPEEVELKDKLMSLNQLETDSYLQQVASILSSAGIEVQTRPLLGPSPTESLQDLVRQEKVDLVVLSAHGSTGTAKWPYGSVATNFIAYGTTPLLVIQDLAESNLQPTKAELAAQERRRH